MSVVVECLLSSIVECCGVWCCVVVSGVVECLLSSVVVSGVVCCGVWCCGV